MKFGDAIEFLKDGYPIHRESWNNSAYVVKQINTDISSDIVPKMQSLPPIAKKLVGELGNGAIKYRQQCLIIRPSEDDVMATNYIPDWIDIFAEDWMTCGIYSKI